MRSRTRLATSILVVGFSSVVASVQPPTRAPATRTIHVDEVIPASAPKTLGERLLQVDAAIRCRVDRNDVRVIHYDVPSGVDASLGAEPATDHTVTVLEVLKSSPRLPIVGFTMGVLQPVGSVVVDGITLVIENDAFRAFKAGEEYVLFLRWNASQGEFEVENGADAFLLAGGTVSTSPHWPYSRDELGVAVPQFLTRVRAAAKDQVR